MCYILWTEHSFYKDKNKGERSFANKRISAAFYKYTNIDVTDVALVFHEFVWFEKYQFYFCKVFSSVFFLAKLADFSIWKIFK